MGGNRVYDRIEPLQRTILSVLEARQCLQARAINDAKGLTSNSGHGSEMMVLERSVGASDPVAQLSGANVLDKFVIPSQLQTQAR